MTSTVKDLGLHLDLPQTWGSRAKETRGRFMVAVARAILLCGCAQAPDHSSAWLSYKFGLTCGDVTACTALRDDNEADEYYKQIGAEDSSNTPVFNFSQWKQQFGIAFNTPVHAV